MLYIRPAFFDEFKCIANKCTDSCCVGWEINIDDETIDVYKNMQTTFGEKIRENIIKNDDVTHSFKLCEDERCPFLNKNNLCDIILNCGEDSICYICQEHPRFYNDFSGVTEYGLGLCCEEVCRLLVENDNALEFIVEEEWLDDSYYDENEAEYYKELCKLREHFYKVLSVEENYDEKIKRIIALTEEYLKEKIAFDSDKVILARYEKTEPINNEWTEYLVDLNENVSRILEKETPFDLDSNGDKKYSKILLHVIFRHLIKSIIVDDKSLKSTLNFCVSSVRFIKLCDMKTYYENGVITLKDRIDNIKRWSKQIEYSDENVDLLTF